MIPRLVGIAACLSTLVTAALAADPVRAQCCSKLVTLVMVGLGPPWAAALSGSALTEFLVGGAQVGEVGLIAMALDLAPHVREEILGAVAAEAGADAAVGSPHQSWHADRRGWRMASHVGSRLC